MNHEFVIKVNQKSLHVPAGTTVAAALMMANAASRTSVCGESRMPLCGMGICMECRAKVNGHRHQRTCQMMCVPGIEIETE